MFDEIQCGMSRTGTLWAFELTPVRPDVLTSAKALASGLPVGAVIAAGEAADVLQPGDHGATFGGGPLVAAAALATLDLLDDDRLQARVRVLGDRLRVGLEALREQGRLTDVRGRGLMVGADLPAADRCRRGARRARGRPCPERDRPVDAALPAAADRGRDGDRPRARIPRGDALNDRCREPIASYEADPEQVGRVLLLYSGGLDTSVMLKWIQDQYGAEIVALTVDLGQPGEDFDVVRDKALRLGALDCLVVDAKEEFARDYVLPAIKANALYGGGYPLFTALGRPLIAKLAVEKARETGCDTIAHGCTGKGNDQVRIETTVASLDPELKMIAPVRSWQMGREEEIAYAREHGIPIKGGTEAPPYSVDDNIWGRSSEGGPIEDLSEPPRDDVWAIVTPPERAPDEPETIEIGFEEGCPVSLDGERLGLVELIERCAEIGGRHGVGIVDHIEDRIVGLKVRDIYEVPAAEIILTAHKELEKLVGTIHQNNFKPDLDRHWAYLVYAGLWYEPLLGDLNAFMDSVNRVGDGHDHDAPLQGARRGGRALVSARALRRGAGGLLRVGRPVQPAGEPRLHRVVVLTEPHGPPCEEPGIRGSKETAMFYKALGFVVWKLAMAAAAPAASAATASRPRRSRLPRRSRRSTSPRANDE